MAHKTRRLGRQAGPVVGVLLPHSPGGRNGALDPEQKHLKTLNISAYWGLAEIRGTVGTFA